MSIIMYKQRHTSSNLKKSKVANYAHIQYIATRPRVLKNQGMEHGLFGRLDTGQIQYFSDYKEIAQLVHGNTGEGVTMYRGIISVSEETAKELMLTNQEQWKRYVERHISTISSKNGIKREDFAFVCAVHNEKSHPHIHIAFWDKTQADRVKNPYVLPKIPNAIRQQLIKDTFSSKILDLAKEKDETVKSIRQITNVMIEDFNTSMQIKSKRKYKLFSNDYYDNEIENSLHFTDKLLNDISQKVLDLKKLLPQKGRLSYKLLPPECKVKTDEIVDYILSNQSDIKILKDSYIHSKMQIVELYSGSDDYMGMQTNKYSNEVDKLIANSILRMVKAVGKAEYEQNTKSYLAEQILYKIFDMLQSILHHSQEQLQIGLKRYGELSKDAKKELYLKMQDKGFEH